jgi:hypothetical protein
VQRKWKKAQSTLLPSTFVYKTGRSSVSIVIRLCCETSRLPHLLDNRIRVGGKVDSITIRPPFTPRKSFQRTSLCNILLTSCGSQLKKSNACYHSAQNLLLPICCLKAQKVNIQFKIYAVVFQPPILSSLFSQSFTPIQNHSKMFCHVLHIIILLWFCMAVKLCLKRDERIGGWKTYA